MIVVLGRPRAVLLLGAGPAARWAPGGRVVAIARAAAAAGARVELVGAIGDDPAGDDLVVGLSREGIGHAALLRDPAAPTPLEPPLDPAAAVPRLDCADVELGLGYLPDCDVLVLADELDSDAFDAAIEAAAYHGARVVVVVPQGPTPPGLADATVLAAPAEPDAAFDARVGRIAADVDTRVRRQLAAAGSGPGGSRS